MSWPHLILGSGSPQRQRLMSEAGYRFDVVVPGEAAECGICSTGGPAALVADLALRKAADVAGRLALREEGKPGISEGCLIIACDTVAECGGAVLGKPNDEEHARNMLRRLSGTVHRVYSGLCLWPHQIPQPIRPIETRVAVTELRMDRLADADLEEYLASGLWRGKAGAFGYQDRVGWLHVDSGSEANVIGLPTELLAEMLVPWESDSMTIA
ncbi:MAG: Maf-like protein [Planctomycetes bacterium]|nr:Maf-like protein [Planctomycetota bacterium]